VEWSYAPKSLNKDRIATEYQGYVAAENELEGATAGEEEEGYGGERSGMGGTGQEEVPLLDAVCKCVEPI
jgi:hypothetical protein